MKTDVERVISFNTDDSEIMTTFEIVTADEILGSFCNCMLSYASTDIIFDLYRRICVEVSKRQVLNPISKLDQWAKKDRRRIINWVYTKTNNGWLISLTVFDEFRKRYFSWNQQDFSDDVPHPKKFSKKLAAANMVQQLSL